MITFVGLTSHFTDGYLVVDHLYFGEPDGTLTQTSGSVSLEYTQLHLTLQAHYLAILDQRGTLLSEKSCPLT